MKKQLKHNIRRFLIVLFLTLFGATMVFLVKEAKMPKMVDRKIPGYSYNQQANINYKVFLKPNMLFPEGSIEEGKIYITELIDHINMSFSYKFTGERSAGIKGDYDAVVIMEALSGVENNKLVWTKQFQLLEKTPFSANEKTVAVNRELPLNLKEYIEFAENAARETKINANINMSVMWRVNLEAATEDGIVREQAAPSIVIPIKSSYFEIGGSPSLDKNGAFEITERIKDPSSEKALILYSIFGGLFMMGFIFLRFLTVGKPDMDMLEKTALKVFRKYGDRLVALDGDIASTHEKVFYVRTIEDLVRVGDEIGKPLMYIYNEENKEVRSFYVIDEPNLYIFEIKHQPSDAAARLKERVRQARPVNQ